MAIDPTKLVNLGNENQGNGDPIRVAFQKVNTLFTELNNTLESNTAGVDFGNVGASIVPSTNLTYNLGSPTKKWHSLYVGTGSVHIGDATLSVANGKLSSNVGFNVDSLTINGVNLTVNEAGKIESSAGFAIGSGTITASDGLTATTDANGNVNVGFSGILYVGSQTQYGFEEIIDEGGPSPVYSSRLSLPMTTEFLGGDIDLTAWGPGVNINVRDTDTFTDYTWAFGDNGSLTFPDGTVQTTAYTGGGGANTGNFIFASNDVSLAPGNAMTLSTYQSGGNKESKLTLSTTGLSSLDVGNNFRIRNGNGTGFEKDWTFGATGSITWPDASIQSTAWTGSVSRLTNSSAELVLTGGATPFVTFPAVGTDQLFIQGSEIAATSGSIALTSIDGSIFLTTHGDLAPALSWQFDRSGTLTTPLGLPKTFTATLDPTHFVGDLTLTGDAWSFEVQFQVNPNGTVQTMIGNNTPFVSNPGYVDGQQFTYTEADHGIPGYTFTLGLADVLLAGPAGWTTNLTASVPPEYPSTVKSLGAIKLSATGETVVPGQQIIASDAQGGITNEYITVWVEGGGTNYPEIVAVQPGWTVVGEGLNYADVIDVELITQFPGSVIYRITTDISSAKMGYEYTFIEPDGLEPDLKNWVFGTDGQLTVPGAIFRDGGLYMNSSGSTTAASVFVNGFAGSVILRTADNANNVSHDLIFDVNGNLRLPGNVTYPGGITQSRQDDTVCNAGVDTVVYTSTGEFQHAIKLFVMIEGMAPNGDGVNWDTQACDVIAVKGFANNIVHVTTYGVTYTSAAAFATFDGQWNATTNRIEITCRPVSPTHGVTVSVHAIEMLSNN